MTKAEVIEYNNVLPDEYQSLADKAIKYALISVAFTYNRMDLSQLRDRISNITKGKIAELLFYHYCNTNKINIDPEACSTPFWLPDNRDFYWLEGEWDIKNNYFFCDDKDANGFDCTKLPALIPNKSAYDQWSKRNAHLIPFSKYNAYIFTFMRLRPKNKNYFTVELIPEQLDFLTSLVAKFNNSSHSNMPFLEKWFFDELNKRGPCEYISLQYHPELYITGCANPKYWHLFKDIPSENENQYHIDCIENKKWYTSTNSIVSYHDGALRTKIRNKACPILLLPSFKSILKNLTKQT